MLEKRVLQSSTVDFATDYACLIVGLGILCPFIAYDRWTFTFRLRNALLLSDFFDLSGQIRPNLLDLSEEIIFVI